uniref:PiggyBac transposable element-derived protein domain-containing protein n=1 Tax=Octopus bimaculoides TaxID=37653 RepID=A0A0L8HKK0_OCTBM
MENAKGKNDDDVLLARLLDDADDLKPNMDKDLASLLSSPTWIDIPFQAPDTEFKGTMERAPDDGNLKTLYQFFKEFKMDKMLNDVVTETNIYSHQKIKTIMRTTKKEVEIALYHRMGVVQAHCIHSHWENSTRYEPVADRMG